MRPKPTFRVNIFTRLERDQTIVGAFSITHPCLYVSIFVVCTIFPMLFSVYGKYSRVSSGKTVGTSHLTEMARAFCVESTCWIEQLKRTGREAFPCRVVKGFKHLLEDYILKNNFTTISNNLDLSLIVYTHWTNQPCLHSMIYHSKVSNFLKYQKSYDISHWLIYAVKLDYPIIHIAKK